MGQLKDRVAQLETLLQSQKSQSPEDLTTVLVRDGLNKVVGPGSTTEGSPSPSPSTAATSRGIHESSPIDPVLDGMTEETMEHIFELYWSNFDCILDFVDREAFYQAWQEGDPQYYSHPLHVAILAVGLRYCDAARPDLKPLIAGPTNESRLLVAARRLVERDLESAKGLPPIQALLLIGDAEAAIGSYQTAWMYIGRHPTPMTVHASRELTVADRHGLPFGRPSWPTSEEHVRGTNTL